MTAAGRPSTWEGTPEMSDENRERTDSKNESGARAPARDDGLKPWVRESYHFGETTYSIVYANTAPEAKGMYGRMHLETVRVRRATVADVERHA